MGYWIKVFTDDSTELGSDELIARKKASWSKGKLVNIAEVKLANSLSFARLAVPSTIWHQFDRFSIVIGSPQHNIEPTHRVVQAQIQDQIVRQMIVLVVTPMLGVLFQN